MSNLQRWIIEEINRLGWTQAELSRRADVSAGHVSRVLSGEANLGLELAQGIARAFGISLEEVLRRAGILPAIGELLPEVSSWNDRLRRMEAGRRVLTIRAMETVLVAVETHSPELQSVPAQPPRPNAAVSAATGATDQSS